MVHLIRMPTGRLPREVFQARPMGWGPRGRPRTRWRDNIATLAWEHLGIPLSELVNVVREREVWGPLLELLPPQPDPGCSLKMRMISEMSNSEVDFRNVFLPSIRTNKVSHAMQPANHKKCGKPCKD